MKFFNKNLLETSHLKNIKFLYTYDDMMSLAALAYTPQNEHKSRRSFGNSTLL